MRRILFLLSALLAFAVNADNVKRQIQNLVSQGNRAYDLSQFTRLAECADSADMLFRLGGLSRPDSIQLRVSVDKLFGNYFYLNNMPDSSAAYYEKAINLIHDNPNLDFGQESLSLLYMDISQLYYLKKDYGLATQYMAKVDDIIENDGIYQLGSDKWLTAKMCLAMCLARMKDFNQALTIADTEIANATDTTGLAYSRAKRMRGKILLLANTDRQGALKSYKDYFNTQKKIAFENFSHMTSQQRSEYWQFIRPFIADCYLLEDADPAFLYDVTLFSKGLLLQLSRLSGDDVASKDALKSLSYSWTDIQKRLKSNQAAIEFIQYEKDGNQQMAALLLKPKGKPQFLPLTPPDSILELVGKDIRSTNRVGKDSLYSNHQLHDLVWSEPLLKALASTKRVYFAPDGYLHRLAIEYLPPVEHLEMYRLTSTRRLMESNSSNLTATSPTLFIGGINYDLDRAPSADASNDTLAYSNFLGVNFPTLDESTNEAKAIYQSRNNAADKLITASLASEGEFRSYSPNFESILVSTHGDFCSSNPMSTDVKVLDNDNALSQSVIAFAGVNSYLHDKSFNPNNRFDGLISAKELADIDLSKCKLFTVSACQSALGQISSDGVFGLQRGLKNAGVEAMVLSLWNVNAEATAAFMKAFYSHLANGKSIAQAFASARIELIESQSLADSDEVVLKFNPAVMASRPSKKPTLNFSSPQFSNAFILIDALD